MLVRTPAEQHILGPKNQHILMTNNQFKVVKKPGGIPSTFLFLFFFRLIHIKLVN